MKVGIVIPAFNEVNRIRKSDFEANPEYSFLFIDDGSSDGTAPLIEGWNLPHVKIHKLPSNKGKAEAVRIGMMKIQSVYPGIEWAGFWDADLATPLSEILHALQYGALFYPSADSIWCTRLVRLGSEIRRSYLRHILGRLFMTVVGYLFRDGVYDSQCGAKLFRVKTIESLFGEVFISRWIFDVEILRRAKISGHSIIEYPLKEWKDISGSRLNVGKVMIRVLMDLFRIRKKYQD